MHEGHKLYEINDQESLKKENITINSSSNDFNNILSNLNALKDKIEKEIITLDEAFDKVFNEVGKSYEKKHQILNEEEKNMKEKLQNEVTKIKEKLEINLSESDQLIRENERILKGINSLKKEDENIIKILSYVSKINKNKKTLSNFFLKNMKNLKISFQEEKNNINYEEYDFNPKITIKDIKIENISFDKFDVSWKIDDIYEKIDNNLKFIIEMKVEIDKEKSKKIFEANEMNIKFLNLNGNRNYEIRICTILKGIENPWSEIKKIKTLDWKNYCDSKILQGSNKNGKFCRILKDWTKSNKLELLYRGSRDGPTCNDFHSRCDNKGATICLYKNDKNFIFGGYNPVSWNENDVWIKNDNSFIFTLTNVHNTEPTKFPHKNGEDSIYNNKNYGPTFDDFIIDENYQNSNSVIHFPRGHIDTLNLGKSIFSGDKNNSIDKIKILEIEVYKVLK